MRKYIKLLSLSLAFLMLFSGCGEVSLEEAKGTITPSRAYEEKYDCYYGATYKNEHCEMIGKFSSDWAIHNPRLFAHERSALAASKDNMSFGIIAYDLMSYSKYEDKTEIEFAEICNENEVNGFIKIKTLKSAADKPTRKTVSFMGEDTQMSVWEVKTNSDEDGLITHLVWRAEGYFYDMYIYAYAQHANLTTVRNFIETSFFKLNKSKKK